MGLTTETLKAAFHRLEDGIGAYFDELNGADGKLGDGDLGITLTRASRGIHEVVDELPEDVGQAFLKSAQAVTKAASSSFGTLMATGLMAAAKATRGRTEVPWAEVSGLLDQVLAAMKARGKTDVGMKTVLDPLAACAVATRGLDDPAALMEAADRAITETMDAFRDKPAQVGRARIFGEKSQGLDDPGMLAFRRIVDVLKA
ncbi:MAG: dihydroxyacetone kinase subunit L [Rhodospirillaceae bacterium]|nr:dihydroxyacetone kinase subunit L [Rhodospirillaceae bacterium]